MGHDQDNTDTHNAKRNGWVDIAYKKTLGRIIKGVTPISHRVISAQLRKNISCETIQIVNTCAPHLGYIEEQVGNCQEAKEILKSQAAQQCAIWTTGNNGEISHDAENQNNLIGKWTIAKETEKESGKCYKKSDGGCSRYSLSPRIDSGSREIPLCRSGFVELLNSPYCRKMLKFWDFQIFLKIPVFFLRSHTWYFAF